MGGVVLGSVMQEGGQSLGGGGGGCVASGTTIEGVHVGGGQNWGAPFEVPKKHGVQKGTPNFDTHVEA